jgi:hypothetical protein
MNDETSDQKRGLHAVPDPGRTVRVVVAPRSSPPFDVDAHALEDDTYFVLSAGTEIRETPEHPIRLWTELQNVEPAEPGSVIVKAGSPMRLLAVVHDLSRDPTWREDWVAAALEAVLREAEQRKIRRLGLEPLGCVHGRLRPDRFATLLSAALDRVRPQVLERVWVMPKAGTESAWVNADGEAGTD